MSVAVRNNNKTALVVPASVRRKAGFKSGQEIEFKASGGVIPILAKLPNADGEYRKEQRCAIDKQLDAAEMVAHIKKALKKRSAQKKSTLAYKISNVIPHPKEATLPS